MMPAPNRKYVILLFSAILLLLALDQGVKLAVRELAPPVAEEAVLVSPDHPVDIRLDPTLHAKAAESLTPLAERWGVPLRLLTVGYALLMTAVFLLFCLLAAGVLLLPFRHLPKRRYPQLTCAVLVLGAAGVLASLWADGLLWGGSLDWLRVTWLVEAGERVVEGHTHPLPYVRFNKLIFDLKDVYLLAACILLFVRLGLLLATYARCTPEERAVLKDMERHPIRSIRNLLAHRAQEDRDA